MRYDDEQRQSAAVALGAETVTLAACLGVVLWAVAAFVWMISGDEWQKI